MVVGVGPTRPRRKRWLPALLWVVFGAALVAQVLAPHLKISNSAFVIPPALIAEGKEFHPTEIIARERTLQVFSALLAASSALGLALHYRAALVKAFRPPRGASDS